MKTSLKRVIHNSFMFKKKYIIKLKKGDKLFPILDRRNSKSARIYILNWCIQLSGVLIRAKLGMPLISLLRDNFNIFSSTDLSSYKRVA